MLQNSEALQLSCNQKDHSRQYISAICTRKECDKQSALCQRCILPFHKSCDDHILFLEDLPNQLDQKEKEFGEVDHLIESLIKQLREIQQMYQQTVKPILEYKAVPNMTNLNKVGTMFRQDQKIDLDSIRIGAQLIAGITESYLSLCKPKELSPQEQKDAEEWRRKCQDSYNKNEFQEAIEFIDRALSINPRSDVYWNLKGMALNQQNKYEEAIQCLDAALNINPKNDSAWNNKGRALNQQNKYEEAIQCLDAALKINPKNDSAWNNKGHALHNQKKYEESIKCCDQSLSIKSSFLTYYNKSFPLESLNKLKEAEDCLKKALELNSNHQDSIDRLKAIQAMLKK